MAWRAMTTQQSSLGPNQLIKQRAKLVTSWEDVIVRSCLPRSGPSSYPSRRQIEERAVLIQRSLAPAEHTLYELLTEDGSRHIDDLVEISGRTASEVLAALFDLELKGVVRQLPGKQFLKVLL
jgi:DNA processing protein